MLMLMLMPMLIPRLLRRKQNASQQGEMLELQLDRIVHHLMVEQKCNMLDKTKCSTSARNIYNLALA
jgi:hypothetical protein